MKVFLALVVAVVFAFGLTGCNVSKPYVITKDRTDQELAGNRGYLKGTPPPSNVKRDLKRPFLAVDIDLPQVQGKATQETKLVGMGSVSTTVNEMTGAISPKKSHVEEENIK